MAGRPSPYRSSPTSPQLGATNRKRTAGRLTSNTAIHWAHTNRQAGGRSRGSVRRSGSKSLNYPFFTSPDLVDTASLTAPHSWNAYAYVTANPLNWVDPYGLFLESPDGGGSDWSGGGAGSGGDECEDDQVGICELESGKKVQCCCVNGKLVVCDVQVVTAHPPNVLQDLANLRARLEQPPMTYMRRTPDPPIDSRPTCASVFFDVLNQDIGGVAARDVLEHVYEGLPVAQELLLRRAEYGKGAAEAMKWASRAEKVAALEKAGKYLRAARGLGRFGSYAMAGFGVLAISNAASVAQQASDLGNCK